MRIIVTRPPREAQDWVQALQQAGWQAQALPLIAIGAAPDAGAVQQAWRQLDQYLGVMFVSANAVTGFFEARPADVPFLFAEPGTLTAAWATGPGTRAALRRAGVAPQHIDAPDAQAGQFDSEALWRIMGAQVRVGSRVLIVRGADGQAAEPGQGLGRDWFAGQVQAAGGHVDFVVAYQRRVPQWNAEQERQARAAASDGSIWLFSSSEALANLRACLPGQDWHAARAIATHARIAAAARAAGFGVVCESRPTLADIRASIESMR